MENYCSLKQKNVAGMEAENWSQAAFKIPAQVTTSLM